VYVEEMEVFIQKKKETELQAVSWQKKTFTYRQERCDLLAREL
jgi:hypothetical protein